MRALRTLSIFLVLILVALAGCIQGTPPDDEDDPLPPVESKDEIFGRVQALMDGVPCEASEVGTDTSENLKDLALVEIENAGGTASLDFHDDIMIASTSGMAVMNISDPLNVEVLSVFDEVGGYADVKISPDGQTAIGGTGQRILLVDIRDPEYPELVGEWSLTEAGRPNQGTLNAHMLYTAEIDDEQWVFVAANNNDGVWILRMTGPPEDRELEFVTSSLPIEGGPLGPHDMWVNYDEEDEKWLLYSADGYHGWAVFDVSDPTEPMFEGGHIRPETGYTHTIQAAWIDGRRIVATIGEVGVNLLEVYDATDLKAPILLGTWHMNMEPGTTPQPAAPQHEFNIVNGTLYLGHYENGFYAFDLTQLPMTAPLIATPDLSPVAHYKVSSPDSTSLFSHIWSVDVINGVLYASHMSDGVYVIGYGCNEAGDEELTSTG